MAWSWSHAEVRPLLSVSRASPCRARLPARALIDCSWHSPESMIIPTGICLALEQRCKIPATQHKNQRHLSGKHSVWEQGVRQRQCWVIWFPLLLSPALLRARKAAASPSVPRGLSLSHGEGHWRLRVPLVQCMLYSGTCFFPFDCSTALC